ncbi:MAG: hypothetical protein ACRDMI_00955 [Streptosporangiaceae bacterium]
MNSSECGSKFLDFLAVLLLELRDLAGPVMMTVEHGVTGVCRRQRPPRPPVM